ncbi:hypothetical protein DFH27DRAFT_608073 [Peziza echinospora]|nr:hypothetical protein DFH27DRAFT_608073 [Peziza echinospora]
MPAGGPFYEARRAPQPGPGRGTPSKNVEVCEEAQQLLVVVCKGLSGSFDPVCKTGPTLAEPGGSHTSLHCAASHHSAPTPWPRPPQPRRGRLPRCRKAVPRGACLLIPRGGVGMGGGAGGMGKMRIWIRQASQSSNIDSAPVGCSALARWALAATRPSQPQSGYGDQGRDLVTNLIISVMVVLLGRVPADMSLEQLPVYSFMG